MEMEFLSLVSTSLELNTNSSAIIENAQNKEVQANFIELGRKISVEEETSALVEELNRANAENKRLTEMLTELCENYNSLRKQLKECTIKNQVICKKRKATNNYIANDNTDNISNSNQSSSSRDEDSYHIKKAKVELKHVEPKISTISVRTDISNMSLMVKDGYHWRKYGQKVTRDNPCPRAYFKCSFAPTCPVKKKVQRSSEDQSIIIATYEGEHNHPNPSKPADPTSSPSHSLTLGLANESTSLGSSGPSRPNLSKPNNNTDVKPSNLVAMNSPEFQQFLAEQMASTLTKDPNFKATLAAAVTGKFLR